MLRHLGIVIYWTVLMAVALSNTLSRLREFVVKLRTYEITNIPQRLRKLIYWTGSVTAVVCLLFGALVAVTANGMTTGDAIFVAASFMASALSWLAARWIADKSS